MKVTDVPEILQLSIPEKNTFFRGALGQYIVS